MTRNVRSLETEGAGFEPAIRSHGLWFSRPVHSTALPPLQRKDRTARIARLRGRNGHPTWRSARIRGKRPLDCVAGSQSVPPGEVAEWLKALAC